MAVTRILASCVCLGFPGETQAQHNELVSFVKSFKFERMGCFTYSEEVRLRPLHVCWIDGISAGRYFCYYAVAFSVRVQGSAALLCQGMPQSKA
jgi:hypothetical protein